MKTVLLSSQAAQDHHKMFPVFPPIIARIHSSLTRTFLPTKSRIQSSYKNYNRLVLLVHFVAVYAFAGYVLFRETNIMKKLMTRSQKREDANSDQTQKVSEDQPHVPMMVQEWHGDAHVRARKIMTSDIIDRLKKRQPNAPQGWYDRLPAMCSRLEEALYIDASSFETYNDRDTLGERLKDLGRRLAVLQKHSLKQ